MTDATAPTAVEQPARVDTSRRRLTIGLPKCDDPCERRFPLTPEGAAMLTQRGFTVKMQQGAAATIHYDDERYCAQGVEITERTQALACDIVIYTAPLKVPDARAMRRGAMLLTLLDAACAAPATARVLLERNVIALALDLVRDPGGCTPFADILAEIDGRASVAMASSLLADPVRGKGILLGGVAGIVPCEALVIGSGIAACAAARSALGLGAMVRMFDNDIYSLRRASQLLGPGVITSALHPRTLAGALRTADVILLTHTASPVTFHTSDVALMKRGVLAFDLTAGTTGNAFPTMRPVDLARAADPAALASIAPHTRICYVHAGSAVARTAAMALSNTLLNLMDYFTDGDGTLGALKLHSGIQAAALTFMGKPVNAALARTLGMRPVDISLFLTLS